MRGVSTLTCLLGLAFSVGLVEEASADIDHYFWNYMQHPYQTYYLEDYCGPVDSAKCDSAAHTITVNSTGSGSALIIRGFRSSRPVIQKSIKCCITVKTIDLRKFVVQLDEIFLREKKKLGKMCENFVRIHGIEEELGYICGEINKHSFRTPRNEVEVEYVLNSNNAPEFQKIKLVVTATEDASALAGGRCDVTQQQWQCDNGNCIWEGFLCDAQNNCGDWSDEFYCGFFARHWAEMTGAICAILVISTCCCVYCCCCRKSKKNGIVHGKPSTVPAPPTANDYQFVASFAPPGQPVTGKIYPSLEVPYQRAAGDHVPPPQSGAPPPYSEGTHVTTPAYNPGYGAIKN